MTIELISKNEVKLIDVLKFEELLQSSDSIVYNKFGFDNQNDIIVVYLCTFS